jgi:hypothetical protein
LSTTGAVIRDRIETSWTTRLAIVLAGILLSQVILYGPSLIGSKILLPIDTLAQPGVYIPVTPETAGMVPHDAIQSDLAYIIEPERLFIANELRAGRWPMWVPGQYAGKPVLQGPWLSPLSILFVASPSPLVLAWYQLLAALIAGVGFYLFCRRALGVGFWPAVLTAWNYPLTGFFVLWLGFPTTGAVYWLPWLVLTIDGVVRKPTLPRMVALSLATCALLCNRQLDISGQALIVGGLYGLWRAYETYGRKFLGRPARKAGLLVVCGWLLGFALAAPYVLPVYTYAKAGSRTQQRAAGEEERAPGDLSALPLLVLPDARGSTRNGSYPLPGGPFQIESMSAAYAGLIAALFLAPLAFRSRRYRSFAIFAAGLTYVALAWCLNIGGIVLILRLPVLNLMSHNRLVFAAAFAILAMAAAGLDSLREPVDTSRHRWLFVPVGLVTLLSCWWFYRAVRLPEPIASEIQKMFSEGKIQRWIKDEAGVARVQSWFSRIYVIGGLLGITAAAGWLVLALRRRWRAWMTAAVGAVMFMDMLWFAHDRSAQCDPSLYYPKIPVLEKLATSVTGRIVAFESLPATLAQVSGLRDVRGYDGVDPANYVRLLMLSAEANVNDFGYAHIEWMQPRLRYPTLETVKLSPVLDLLGVEYVIYRGPVQGAFKPSIQGPDYWALKNPSALPRVFVPRRAENVPDEKERLAKLASAEFDPRAVAYIETTVALPEAASGRATIIAEKPTEVTISASMDTPGLVVLTDMWDKGWHATLNGEPVPVLRTDHALRGVVVPEGSAILKFTYAPASFTWGLVLFGLAAAVLAGCLANERRRRRLAPGV